LNKSNQNILHTHINTHTTYHTTMSTPEPDYKKDACTRLMLEYKGKIPTSEATRVVRIPDGGSNAVVLLSNPQLGVALLAQRLFPPIPPDTYDFDMHDHGLEAALVAHAQTVGTFQILRWGTWAEVVLRFLRREYQSVPWGLCD
jgi:hypothetical protein